MRSESAMAVAVRSKDLVALAFRAKYDVKVAMKERIQSEKVAMKETIQSKQSRKRPKKGANVTIRPRKMSGARVGEGTRQQASGVSIDIVGSIDGHGSHESF